MPLRHGYGVLKGVVTDFQATTPCDASHFQIELQADGELFGAAVNVRSKSGRPALLFFVDEDFKHPVTERVGDLPRGFHSLESRPGTGALDYLRGNLFRWAALTALPPDSSDEAGALNARLESLVRRAGDGRTALYIFGQPWGSEPAANDNTFKFEAGRGVRDIHMNQCNPEGPFGDDDGAYQDGAILFQFVNENRWAAVFLAFATQSQPGSDAGDDARAGQPGAERDTA